MGGMLFGCGVVFLVLIVEIGTGAWMRVAGEPYLALPFAIHRIVAVFLVAYLAVIAVKESKTGPVGALAWGFLAATMTILLGSAITGSWIAMAESYPKTLPIVHRVLAYVAAPLAGTSLWFLRGKP